MQREVDGSLVVDDTPTDCVHLSRTGLADLKPDIVVSGINAGANLGDDTLYSGTVAAAMEGRHLGFAAIAVSTVSIQPQHFETGARVTLRLLEQIQRPPHPDDTILHVNIHDIPSQKLPGLAVPS